MRGMGLGACVIVLWCGEAAAQTATPPAQPPAPQPQPVSGDPATPAAPSVGQPPVAAVQPPPPMQPMPAVVGRPLSEHTVDRHGLVLLGGLTTDGDNSSLRVDAIVPTPTASAPELRFGLSVGYDHASAEIPDLAIDAYALGVGVNVFYDWRLPIATDGGDFVVSVEGGPTVGRLWLKIDQLDMPGEYKTVTGFGLRVAAAVQYRAHGGFVASLQPLGIGIPIAHTDEDVSPFTVTSDIGWEGALLCGYQFR